MSSQTFTPFGFRYEGDSCSIKLRFKEDKFRKAELDKYGHYRYTNKGYVIFEITLRTNSPEFRDVSAKINSAK